MIEREEDGRTIRRESAEVLVLVVACLLAALICTYWIYAALGT
jgi:hypothetical protein